MENLNVILALLAALGVGSSVIHYASSKKAQARVCAKAKPSQNAQ